MQSDTDQFMEFVSTLQNKGIVDECDVVKALDSLDGLEGVISEEYFIFGYEELGWYISEKLSFEELVDFVEKNHDVLLGHKGPRYYFVQSLVDQPKFNKEEISSLILKMPNQHQPFLKKRFL